MRNLLRSKGISVPIICPMCDHDIEHMLHLFFDCPFATACWNIADLSYNMREVEVAPKWLLDKISRDNAGTLEKVAAVLSGIWFARNKKVWDGIILNPTIAMNISKKQISEWQETTRKKRDMNHIIPKPAQVAKIKWLPPHHGYTKLNVDASLYMGEESFTLGMVVRNEKGQYINGKNLKLLGSVSVMEAEARGVQEALKWIEELGLQNVILECDSELVVSAIHKEVAYHLEVGHIVAYCRLKLENRTDISLCHVKKQANRAAHLMARVPCLLNCYNIFLSPPNLLLETLFLDSLF